MRLIKEINYVLSERDPEEIESFKMNSYKSVSATPSPRSIGKPSVFGSNVTKVEGPAKPFAVVTLKPREKKAAVPSFNPKGEIIRKQLFRRLMQREKYQT